MGEEIRGLWDTVPLNPSERRAKPKVRPYCPDCSSSAVTYSDDIYFSSSYHEEWGEQGNGAFCESCEWAWPLDCDPAGHDNAMHKLKASKQTNDLPRFYFIPYWELPTGDMIAAYDNQLFYGKRLRESSETHYPLYCWGEYNPEPENKETTDEDS